MSLLLVPLSLGLPQLGILAFFLRKQLFVVSFLHQSAVMENRYSVTKTAGGKPVGNIKSPLLIGHFAESGVNIRLCNRIQSCCGLIQDHKGCILIESPGDSNFLRLAPGYIYTVVFHSVKRLLSLLGSFAAQAPMPAFSKHSWARSSSYCIEAATFSPRGRANS